MRRRKEWDLKFHKGKCLEQRQSGEYGVTAAGHPVALQYPDYQTDIVHMVFKSYSSPYKYRDVVLVRSFALIDKTRTEFEAAGYKQRQCVGPSASSYPSNAASSTPPSSSSSGDDASASPGSKKETEEPIFAEGCFADGGMIFGTRSVIHAAGPEFKDNVRAVLYPTGYILTPLRNQQIEIHPPQSSSAAPVVCSDVGSSCLLTFISQMDRESVLIVSPDLLGETNELRQTIRNIKTCLARDRGLRTLRSSVHTQQLRLFSGRPDPSAAPPARAASIVSNNNTTESSVPWTYGARQPILESDSSEQSPQQSPKLQTRGLPVIPEKR